MHAHTIEKILNGIHVRMCPYVLKYKIFSLVLMNLISICSYLDVYQIIIKIKLAWKCRDKLLREKNIKGAQRSRKR